jgi:hypothetical protein
MRTRHIAAVGVALVIAAGCGSNSQTSSSGTSVRPSSAWSLHRPDEATWRR